MARDDTAGTTKRVSVLMAVFNGEDYVADAVDSVLDELEPEDELIVVDDGSTDRTANVLSSYAGRIQVLHQPNAGQSSALNAAVAMAWGEFLAFNDADDLWVAGRMREQLAALARNAALDGVYGMSEQFVSPELDSETRARIEPPKTLLVGQVLACLLVRRAGFERVGSFDGNLRYAHFHDWLQRSRTVGLVTSVTDNVVHRRRLHPANTGRIRRGERDAEVMQVLYRQIRARKAGSVLLD